MNVFSRLSFRVKLVGMALLVIAMMGGAAFWSMHSMSIAFEQDVTEKYTREATDLGMKIAAQFYERYGDVQAFAVNDAVRSMNGKTMQLALDEYVRLYGLYDLILVVDTQGRYVGSNSKDVEGVPVDLAGLSGISYAEAPWFKAAINGKFTEDEAKGFAGTFFEETHVDPVMKLAFGANRIGTGFTSVIKDKQGQVVGVITNRAKTKWIDAEIVSSYEQLKKAGMEDAMITLVNRSGLFLADYRPKEDGKSELFYDTKKTFLVKNIKANHVPVGRILMKGGTGSVYSADADDNGNEDIVGYHWLDNPKWIRSVGWGILVHDDPDDAMKHVLSARHEFWVIFSLNVLIATALFFWFAWGISRQISSVAKTLDEATTAVNETGGSISSSSVRLSEAATQQAAALQETMAAIEEISAMVDKNSESANRSRQVSGESRESATNGRQTVEEMLQAIDEIDRTNGDISSQMEVSNQQLAEITKLINDIGSKTKVINEIVFQTKLLSFNASVEAARAGEYGKGFAVVAEEVGNLAQMSGNAAKEITTLLEDSVRKVESIVQDSKSRVERLMTISKQKVEVGSNTARKCNEALEQILRNVSSVDTMISEIAVASQEQATGIREISNAVGQMEEVTQGNSEVAQSTSSVASRLNDQSSRLVKVVSELNRLVTGNDVIAGAEAPMSSGSNVVSIKNREPKVAKPSPSAKVRAESSTKVAGSDVIPSANDPGFEE